MLSYMTVDSKYQWRPRLRFTLCLSVHFRLQQQTRTMNVFQLATFLLLAVTTAEASLRGQHTAVQQGGTSSHVHFTNTSSAQRKRLRHS